MSSPAQPTVLPIRLRFADGYQLQASASLVGANDLLTATHVVYQPQHGGWASELAIVDEHGQATPVSGWQVWANPRQVYADTDPTTLTLGESQYDLALIGLNRQLPGSPLSLASDSQAPSGSAFGYPQGQTLTDLHTDLQHGQDGYSVYQSSNTELGPGSSGGPLLNEAGQLIGINSAGTPGSATWWADIGPFLPQLTEQMQANDSLLQDTGLNHAGLQQTRTGDSLPALLPTGQETVGGQVPNAVAEGVLYRCVKYNNGAYFYTANPAEIQSIQDNYLDLIRFEGYAFSCLTSGSKPVYRFALTDGSGAYFYTADPNERATVAAQTGKYRDEGIQFYAAQDNDSSATPVYRLKSATGSYLYTANEAEKNAATSLYGYTYEPKNRSWLI